MSWEDQGRQEHVWFGNGTAPPKDAMGEGTSNERSGPDGAYSTDAAAARAYAWAKTYGPVLFGFPRGGAALEEFAEEARRIERARPGSLARALERWAAQGKFGVPARAVRDGLLTLASDDAYHLSPDDAPQVRLFAGGVPEDEELRRVGPEGQALSDAEVLRQTLYWGARAQLAKIDPGNPILQRQFLSEPGGFVPSQAEVKEVARALENARAGGPTPSGPVNTFASPGRPPDQAPPPPLVTLDASGLGTRTGKLIGSLDGLSPDERNFAQELSIRGHDVEIVPTGAGRTPDFKVDGVPTELKTLSGVVNQTADGLSAALSSRIMDARGQSGVIIVDARSQPGMTKEFAQRGIKRTANADERSGNKIRSVIVLTPTGAASFWRKY